MATMLSGPKQLMLRALKVPPDPHLPAGSAETAQVFRASKRYLQLKLLNWGVGQALTLVGLVAALVALQAIEAGTLDVLSKIPHRGIVLRFLGWIEAFCRRFGAGRLLFGTGIPFWVPASVVSAVSYARISWDEKALIAGDNLRGLLGEVGDA